MNDGDNKVDGSGAEDPPGKSQDGTGVAGRNRPYLVRFESALRILRRSDPGLTEEDAVWALWDALRNKRVTAELPYREMREMRVVEPGEDGRWRMNITPHDDKQIIRAASFDKDELAREFPPRASTAPEGPGGEPADHPRGGAIAAAGPSVRLSRKGVGGAPRKYDWDALGAAFGAWLNDATGRDQLGEDAHVKVLATLAEEMNIQAPDRSTAQPYLARWLKGYQAFLRSDRV
jgi:hypothetical protein